MSCRSFQRRMSDALANSQTALSGDVTAHVRSCAACREFHVTQQRLFSAIDAGVRAMMNEEVPTSPLCTVRTGMEETRVGRPWPPWLVPATGVLVVALLIVSPLLRYSFRTKDVRVGVVAEGQRGDKESPTDPNEVTTQLPGPDRPTVKVHRVGRQSAVVPVPLASTPATLPAVLIDPREARALVQLAEAVREDPQWAIAMTHRMELPVSQGDSIEPIKVTDLEVKPLSFESE